MHSCTVRTRLCFATGVSSHGAMNCIWHFHCAREPNQSLREHSNVQDRKNCICGTLKTCR